MLKISKNLIDEIKNQAKEGYPFEICGFLIGKMDYNTNTREVYEVVQVENQNKERANDRFNISPKDYIKVENYADSKGYQIVGIYHSHPDHPDRPSQTDLQFALPDLSYIIVSVKKGNPISYKSWYLEGDKFILEEVDEG